MKTTDDIHVTLEADEWVVRRHTDDKPLSTFTDETHAINYGRDQARNERAVLVVHGADGRVRDRHSYGNDPGDARD